MSAEHRKLFARTSQGRCAVRIAAAFFLFLTAFVAARGADEQPPLQAPGNVQEQPNPANTPSPAPRKVSAASASHRVKLSFKQVPWAKVLARVAKRGGLTLVMKSAPPGTLTRQDESYYNLPQAIRILNEELQPTGFRLVRQGDFLLVLDLDDLRSAYNRPSVIRHVRDSAGASGETGDSQIQQASATEPPVPNPAAETTDPADDKRRVRINFYSTSWPSVLNSVAEQAGLMLVAKRWPPGTLHHPDLKKYTLAETIQILNRELDSTGFRLVRQGKFLIVLDREDIRSEYPRPVIGQRPRKELLVEPISASASLQPQVSAAANTVSAGVAAPIENALHESQAEAPRSQPMTLVHQSGSEAVAGDARTAEPVVADPEPDSAAKTASYTLRHQRAEVIAKRLYAAMKARSTLLDPGPEGLPALQLQTVTPASGSKHSAQRTSPRISCTVGVDVEHNRLVVEAPPKRRAAAIHLFERLDEPVPPDLELRLVSGDDTTLTIGENLAPELNRMVAQRGRGAGRSQPQVISKEPTGERSISDIIKGLKGDVTVESVPELGILILRGGQSDVDAVMKVIREIERLSAGAAPQIHLVPLQYVNSESFAKLLNEVYTSLTTMRTGEERPKTTIKIFPVVKPNAILILAPPADMPAVEKLVKELDQPVSPNMEFQVFQLRRGLATQVAKSINDFYKGRAGLGTVVSAIADPRTNSVIVQAMPRDLAEVARLVERLDQPTAAAAQIKVFTLQNGDAATITRLLDSLFQTNAQRPGGAVPEAQTGENAETGPTPTRFTADIRTNSIIAIGPPERLRAAEAIILRLDNSDAHQRQTVVIRLKNNSSDAVQRAVDTFIRSQRELQTIDPELVSTVELLEREIFVVSEPVSNSLLLSATPRYFGDLNRMIEKLDAAPTQVIIQALIVEVQLDNTDEFGIELGFQTPDLFNRSLINNTTNPPLILNTTNTAPNGVQTTTQRIVSEQFDPGFQFGNPATGIPLNPAAGAASVGSQELSNFGMGRVNPTLGFGGLVLSASSESVSAMLRALSYKHTLHVLSRPQIRTVDNQQASIQVGQMVPIINNVIVTTTGALQPVVGYQPAGIILGVWPRIAPDGSIVMHVAAEKSQYEPGGVTLLTETGSGRPIQSPIKDITRAEATVSLASGNTVVLGGMITTSDEAITRKVPWLADLPIVGQAFRYDSKTTQRKELLIFLTPRMIRDDADDEMIKQIESERLHFIMEEAEQIHGPILSCNPPIIRDGVLSTPISPTGTVFPSGTPLTPPPAPAPPVGVPATRPPVPMTPSPSAPPTAPSLPPLTPSPPALTPTPPQLRPIQGEDDEWGTPPSKQAARSPQPLRKETGEEKQGTSHSTDGFGNVRLSGFDEPGGPSSGANTVLGSGK